MRQDPPQPSSVAFSQIAATVWAVRRLVSPVKVVSSPTRQAAQELVHAHQSSIRGFLIFLGCPSTLVDDVVQDVFLSVLSSSFQYRSRHEAAAYLRKAARHLLLKTLRREERHPVLLDFAVADPAWEEYEGDDAGESYVRALRECLRGLTDRAREVLRLRYQASLKQAAIAVQLNLSEAGVKSVLVRSRKKLRVCVERRLV